MERDLFPNEFAYIINPDTTNFDKSSFFLTNERGAEKALSNLKQKIGSLIQENFLKFDSFSLNYETTRSPQRKIIISSPSRPQEEKSQVPIVRFKMI
jgi:hypothetical protein